MFSKWRLGVLAPVALALLAPTAGLAAPGELARPRVVVVNAVDLPESLADIRAQLRTTLNDAVTKHGYDLAPQASSCADRECLRVAAVNSGASDVLVATGGRNDMRGYHIELRIWNVASDREDNAVAECNICAAAQMIESVATAADPLLDRVPTLHANLSATAIPNPVVVQPPEAPPAIVAVPAPVPEAKPQRRWIGWSLIGAGAAGGVVAGYLFAINGNNTDCQSNGSCVYHWSTVVPASIVVGASAAAIAGGILYLHYTGKDHAEVALMVQPFGLTLGGRL